MTRRVRFSPFAVAGVFAAAMALADAGSARAADVPLVLQPPVTTNVLFTLTVSAADIDGDGDADLLSASFDDDKVVWHENVAGDGSTWTPHTILPAIDAASFVSAADLDGDGDQDLFATSFSGLIFRLENVAGDGSIWARLTIGAFNGAETIVPADLDGDGDLDGLVAARAADTVGWYENVGGTGSSWVPHVITTLADGAESTFAVDLDRDGDIDALSASFWDDTIAWYENAAGNGAAWTRRTISLAANGADFVVAADVDGDGDPDVLSSAFYGNAIAWHENVAGDGSVWMDHNITLNVLRPESVAAIDFDGDGDVDVLSASGGDNRVAWYENTGGPVWTTHSIATLTNPYSVIAADVDGDGDPDVVTGDGHAVLWHRNESIRESACFVSRPALSTAAFGVVAGFAGDLDGDGDQDVVSATSIDDKVSWYDNVAGDASSWTTRPITTAAPEAYGAAGADVDGDGDPDVLSASLADNKIAWHENAAGNGSAWILRTITTAALGATAVVAADVDRDGDVDAVSSSFYDDKIAWYENAAGNGSVWTTRTIDTAADGAHAVTVADIDADGDVDALSASFNDSTIAWYENSTGNGSAWTAHTVSTAASGTVFVSTTDMDRDGDQDVLAVWHTGDTVAWYENTAGNGSAWTLRLISTAANGAEHVSVADVDRDGDADVLAAAFRGSTVAWYENTAGNATAWAAHTLSTTASGASEVFAADLDGDGDSDIVAAASLDHTVAWYENRAGQVALTAIDTAPPTANNGELAAMLRIDVVHLGRAGDHDLELASLGLRFDEAPQDPLTTAEANALVESLRVYRDANGNGVFEPTDTLVTSVADLALAGGVQVVPFTDGDPNVQMAFGSPRTYFVVVELTADAGGQSPHQFQLTHLGLGPLASVAEDRGYDIRLRLACPTDVSSSIKQVVPVELLGFSVE